MDCTRREFGKIALATATLPVARKLMAAAKPNSTFGGVQIGIITYSFRALPGSAEETLKYCLDCGIDGIELMSNVAEGFAGSPQQQRGGPGGAPGGPPPGAADGRRSAAGAAGAPPGAAAARSAAAARRSLRNSRRRCASAPKT